MSYIKQNFVDGQTLTAAHLNHMEAGIAAAATGVKGDKGDPGEGVSEIAKELLLNLFENAAYKTSDAQDTLNALRVEWGRSAQDIPVQSVSLSSSTLTLNEGESKTLTATVLPANATSHVVVWRVAPAGFATVANGVVTGIKAGNCTVIATAGGKSASCTVTVAEVETAQLLYDLPGETALTKGIDTGVKMLEHAGTETPQYTILLDAKASDRFNDKAWIVFVHCMTETGDNFNLPGININLNPNNGTTSIAYYDYCDVTLSDSVAHLKTRTRYVIQLDGQKYRGGSTHCTLSGWKVTKHTLTDVPESLLIGGAPGTNGGEMTRCWDGTLYQCKVYKGLLSDTKINKFIQEGTVLSMMYMVIPSVQQAATCCTGRNMWPAETALPQATRPATRMLPATPARTRIFTTRS